MSDKKWLYVTEFSSFGSVGLARVILVNETEKTYLVDRWRKESLLGHVYLVDRLLKDKYRCFFDPNDAIDHLIKCNNRYMNRLRNNIDNANQVGNQLQELRSALGEG